MYDRRTEALLNQIEFATTPYHSEAQLETLTQGTLIGFGFVDGATVMYHDADPGMPAPTLTAQVPDHILIGHQTALSGTLTRSSGVAGSTITIRDDGTGNTLATTTTDADGFWSVPYTFDTPKAYYLTVTSSAAQGEKAATTRLIVIVEKFVADFGLRTPGTVEPGQEVNVTGTLSADGRLLGGKGLTWSVQCLDQGYVEHLPSGSTTTADDGTYSISYDQGRCPDARLGVEYGGDDQVYDSYDTIDTSVSWHIIDVTVTAPTSAYVGDGASGTVMVTLDGRPAVDVAVDAQVLIPGVDSEDISGTTGADGTLPVFFATPIHGTYRVTAQVTDSPDTLGDYAESLLQVDQVGSDLSVQIDKSEIPVGGTFTFTGTLSHADGSSTAGSTIDIEVADPTFTTTYYRLTGIVAADGTFEITDAPTAPGNFAYRVMYNGEPPRYEPWQSGYTAFVVVDKIAPQLSIRADRTSYTAGDKATLRVDLADSSTRQVTVTATHEGLQPVVFFTGSVPEDGLTLTRTMARSETITVTTAADEIHQNAEASATAPVRLALTTYPQRPVQWHGETAVFSGGDDPVFRCVQAKPRRADVKVSFVVQRRFSSGWRDVVSSKPLRFDPNGLTGWTFSHHHRRGVPYRVRTVFPGDSGNATSASNWLSFRFRLD